MYIFVPLYSLEGFICDQLQIDPAYLEARIQTIFVDGKAVDDVSTTVVRPGCTVALSAAMPGLAGATLRRGGYYATLRHQISHREKNRECTAGEGIITLKLFNLLMTEIGPRVLRHGILFRADALQSFFDLRPASFFQELQQVLIDGRISPRGQLMTQPWKTAEIVLKARSAG